MILQRERAFAVLVIFADGLVAGRSENFTMVLHENAVMENRDVSRFKELAVVCEFRSIFLFSFPYSNAPFVEFPFPLLRGHYCPICTKE